LCWGLFWRTSHCYGLVCSISGWILASLAFVSGCSFGIVGIQASVLSFHPLFNSATPVFLAQLPCDIFGFNFFRLNLFPLKASPLASFSLSNQTLLLPFFFQFPKFSHVVGSLLSIIPSKSKSRDHVFHPGHHHQPHISRK
jgi:hypothetical protein